VGVGTYLNRPSRIPARTFRIGFEPNPPFQIRTASGFGGLAIDVVNQAAQRAGLRLQWVETGTSSDEAFQRGLVDLWPLMADLPERRKRVHLTRPWLHGSHILLLRANAPTPAQDFTGRIALFRLPLHTRLARAQFPRAQLALLPGAGDVIKEVCAGRASAGFLEGRVAMNALKAQPPECASATLRAQSLPDLTLNNCLASTFEAAPAAELLRREIGNEFRDGTLAMIVAEYSYYGLEDTWATYNLMAAAERARWIAWGTGALAVILTLTIWRACVSRYRRRTEQVVRANEERFRAIFQQAGVGIAQLSLEGKVEMANDRYCDVIGYDRAELLGKGTREMTSREDLQVQLKMLPRLMSGQIPSFCTEKRYTRRDGAIVWARMWKSLVREENGKPKYFIAVIEDITEQVNARQLLRESEGRLKTAQRLTHVGNWDWDIVANQLVWSEEIYRIFGESQSYLPDYSRFLQFVTPHDRERVEQSVKDWLAEGGEHSIEFQIARPDGTVRTVGCISEVVWDQTGAPVRMVGACQDITERKQAEVALRASEQRIRNLADTVPVMIWGAGPDKLFTFFNKTWLDFTGRTMKEELGTGWTRIVHPEDLDECYARFCSAFDGRERFHLERRLRRSDGEYRWMLCSGVPLFEEGVFAGYIGSDIDITDLKRAQDEALARQKLESLGVLTSGIAHDFNNLLGGILASVEYILSELTHRSTVDWEELLRIRASAIRGGEIVRQLMIYGGESSEAFESIDLSRLVSEMLELLKVSISKLATLKVNLPEALPAVRANATEMRQVIMNLILNASDALEGKEGVISVTVSQVWLDDPDRNTSDLSRGDYLRLEVGDTGCGMTKEIQARIFDPFFTTKFVGRGLGLAAVQGIVHSHGGSIKIASAPGEGSRFEVLLPCSSEAVRHKNEPCVSAGCGEREPLAGTVLVVEDEVELRVAVSKMLGRIGLSVVQADNGAMGIDLFRAKAPEIRVVLLDMTLPGLSGRAVLNELRRIQPGVNIIITSAYSQKWVQAAIGEQRGWLYIRKPYLLSELTGLVRSICSDK